MTAADEPLLLDSPPLMPCLHPRARHQHGTRGAYKEDRCRCFRCRLAASQYLSARREAISYGRWNAFADAGPVRRHVFRVMKTRGIGWKAVAKSAGLSEDTVKRLLYDLPERNIKRSRRVRRTTADRLLALPVRGQFPATPDLFTKEVTGS